MTVAVSAEPEYDPLTHALETRPGIKTLACELCSMLPELPNVAGAALTHSVECPSLVNVYYRPTLSSLLAECARRLGSHVTVTFDRDENGCTMTVTRAPYLLHR